MVVTSDKGCTNIGRLIDVATKFFTLRLIFVYPWYGTGFMSRLLSIIFVGLLYGTGFMSRLKSLIFVGP